MIQSDYSYFEEPCNDYLNGKVFEGDWDKKYEGVSLKRVYINAEGMLFYLTFKPLSIIKQKKLPYTHWKIPKYQILRSGTAFKSEIYDKL